MVRAVSAWLAACLSCAAADLTRAYVSGAALTEAKAAVFEASQARNQSTPAGRAALLGWYDSRPTPPPGGRREALILALALEGAFGQGGLAEAGAGRLAPDSEAFARVKVALGERTRRPGAVPADRAGLAWFLFPSDPEAAIGSTAENGLLRDTGIMAAQYLLGVTTPDARSTPFGRGLLQMPADTPDPLFQFALGHTLRTLGARLRGEGKLEWDYSALADEALARAAKAEPQQSNCGFDKTAAPAPVAHEGNGPVTFQALIGCSGHAVSLEWIDGPAAQVSAAKREIATRQFDVPIADGQARQRLARVAAGGK